jgi:hypothetical protein
VREDYQVPADVRSWWSWRRIRKSCEQGHHDRQLF